MKMIIKTLAVLFFLLLTPLLINADPPNRPIYPFEGCCVLEKWWEAPGIDCLRFCSSMILQESGISVDDLENGVGPYKYGDYVKIIGWVYDREFNDKCSFLSSVFLYTHIITACDGTYTCGDLNDDGTINILDIVFLINYLYKSGPAPFPVQTANFNYGYTENDHVDILDVIHLINFKYKGGLQLACP